MGKHANYGQRVEQEKEQGPRPMWRGIGCLLIVLIIAMSYAGAVELVNANAKNGWIMVPPEIRGSLPMIPGLNLQISYAELIVAFFLAVFGFGMFVIVYSFIYRIGAPKTKDISVHDI
ncbi:MAG: hypothetical protein DRI56_04090 [Chloroflexota bacterium]|nr:MAG: hypothetical protein DRI56_04090 [Chloroflexota bacterium]